MRVPLKITAGFRRLATKENRWAFGLFFILVLVIILTAESTPLWIYQGF